MTAPTSQPSFLFQGTKSNEEDDSLDYILPLTIVGGLAVCAAAGALYYYCNIPRATISLDSYKDHFIYNEFLDA